MKFVIKISLALSIILSVNFIAIAPISVSAACSPPSPSYGSDTISSFNVVQPGTYSVWVNMYITSSANNSVLMQFDSNCYNVGAGGVPVNTWSWINYTDGSLSNSVKLQLSSGLHSIVLYGNKPTVEVHTILLLDNSSCVPVGNASNCTSDSSVSIPTGTGSSNKSVPSLGSKYTHSSSSSNVITNNSPTLPSNISTPTTLNPVYIPGLTIKDVKYYINDKLVNTATKAPYSYKLNTNKLTNGRYKITVITYYTNGTSAKITNLVNVKHAFFKEASIVAMNNYLLILLLIAGFIFIIFKFNYINRKLIHNHLTSGKSSFNKKRGNDIDLDTKIVMPTGSLKTTTPGNEANEPTAKQSKTNTPKITIIKPSKKI